MPPSFSERGTLCDEWYGKEETDVNGQDFMDRWPVASERVEPSKIEPAILAR
jgi:hypothetical protein